MAESKIASRQEKKCPKCNEFKNINDFGKRTRSPDGRNEYCRLCNSIIAKKWRDAKPERREYRNASAKKWRANNKERVKQKFSTWRLNNSENIKYRKLKNKYNISKEEYDIMFLKQDGKCAICKKYEIRDGYSLAVDHSHVTGKVRALLCSKCNRGLGALNENKELITESINYIIKHNTTEEPLKYDKNNLPYDEIFLKQDGQCAICKEKQLTRKLCVDHNHATGRLRKLLCMKCNIALGAFEEDINLFSIAINYLNKHSTSEVVC